VTEPPRPDRALRRRMLWLSLGLAAAVLFLGATLLVLYARGGGPLPPALGFLTASSTSDPLAPSGSAQTALRTLRLAGYDSAVVGESGGTVVVRVAVPELSAPAKVELSWQTALVAGAEAYPRAERVVAQLFTAGATPLLEVSADAPVIRQAAASDDAAGLRKATSFRYLATAGGSQ
jgi:hypothetical protein